MKDDDFMARAVELSARALVDPGIRPFGAVVVRDGRIVGQGMNRALATNDPTAHGEIEAIRAACAALGSTSLKGCVLYTSCEPCSMCAAAILIANLDAVVYAASLQDSAEVYAAFPGARRAIPIAASELRRLVGSPIEERRPPARRALGDAAIHVLRAYAERFAT